MRVAMPYVLVAPVAIYLAVTLILPLAIQAYMSFLSRELGTFTYHVVQKPTLANYEAVFRQADLVYSLFFTLAVSLVISLGSILLGLPVAQFLARGRGRGRTFVEMSLLLPLFGDIFLAFAMIYAFAPQGIVNRALTSVGLVRDPIRLSGTPLAAIIVLMLPSIAVLLMRGALTRVDSIYEEAATMLGAGPVRAWFSTTFALARVGVAGAFLLVFAGSVGAYTLPIILAGRTNDWTSTKIAIADSLNNAPLAAALSMLLILLVMSVLYLNVRMSRRRWEEQRHAGES
jgi:ABC-type spermidine/putrescine transport system permease subunit I